MAELESSNTLEIISFLISRSRKTEEYWLVAAELVFMVITDRKDQEAFIDWVSNNSEALLLYHSSPYNATKKFQKLQKLRGNFK